MKETEGDVIHDGVDTGDKYQGEEGGETQAPDDSQRGGANEGIAASDHVGDRDKTEDRGHRGEDHRPQPQATGLDDGRTPVALVFSQFIDELHQHDRVIDHHTGQPDHPQKGHKAEWYVMNEEADYDADNSEGNG